MKAIVQVSRWVFVGLLVGAAELVPVRADTNTPYTVSFENYVVRGQTYSVPAVTVTSDGTLPKLPSSTLYGWLLGWADAAETKYYNAKGEPLVKTFTAEDNVTLHALIDESYFVHTLKFQSYTVGGNTYSLDSQTYREGEALKDLTMTAEMPWFMGWYSGENGKGTLYFDQSGHAQVATYDLEKDLTLYPKLNPDYLPLGVRVNGQELDGVTEAGRRGEGWSFDFDRRLVTLNAETEYVLTGCQTNSNVHILVATNTTLVLSNLVLATSLSTRAGLIDVARGVKIDVCLMGENSLDASQAANVAGIFCPTGTSVKITGTRKRDVIFENSVGMSSHGVLTACEYAARDLTVKGGSSAAAIGGRMSTDGGVSGVVVVQNCSLWVQGGSGACEIGAGNASLTTSQTNACGTVCFLNYPNVRFPDQNTTLLPRVGPVIHGDWNTPLFPRVVSSARADLDQSFHNVYWFPYGTTRVRTATYYSSSQIVTNEVTHTVTHLTH